MSSLSKLANFKSENKIEFDEKEIEVAANAVTTTTNSSLVETLLRHWKLVSVGSFAFVAVLCGIYYLTSKASPAPPKKSTPSKKKKSKTETETNKKNETQTQSQTTSTSQSQPQPQSQSQSQSNQETQAPETVDNRTAEEKASRSKEKGNKYYQAKQYEKAAELYTEAISLVPNGPESHIYYGNRAACYSNLNDNEKALEDCNSALKLNPKYAKALSRRANVLETLGKFFEALDDMTACCIFDRFSTPTFIQTADRILKKISEDKLKSILEGRVHEMPSPSFITSYLSSFCYQFSIPQNVETEADKLYVKSLEEMNKAEYEESLEHARQAILKETTYKAEAYNIVGTYYYLMGDIDNALKNFDTSLEISPKNVNTIVKRASLLFEAKQVARSTEEYKKAISIEADNPDIYYHRGQVSYLQGDFESSMSDYQRSVDLQTTVPFPYIQQAVIHYRHQEIQTSIHLFQAATQKFPKNSDVWNYYGEILLDQGDVKGAEENFNKALELNPNNALCYINKGVLEWRVKQNINDAIQFMKQAIEIDIKCEIAYAQLGQLYQQMSKRDECLNAYDNAIKYTRSEVELGQWISLKEAAASQFRIFEKYPEIPSLIAQTQNLQN